MNPRMNFVHRPKTAVILIHHLPNLSFPVRPCDIEAAFRRMGFMASGFHFIVDQEGILHDGGREVKQIGLYFRDSIDIAVLCPGESPSLAQQHALDDLVEYGLKRDYPETNLEVRTVATSLCPMTDSTKATRRRSGPSEPKSLPRLPQERLATQANRD
jgi:hypothetical protein